MASATAQARANALNAKLEGEAQVAIDQIDKQFIRPIARQSYACALKCYDKAGSSGDSQQLELCARKCQMPHQQAGQYVQQEISQFQNRLNRSMQECQDKARDMMQPGYEHDAKKMAMVEDALIACMQKTVDGHILLIKPMKERVQQQLKTL